MISIFDLFSIGIGPSSSHTVGPMRAAYTFVTELAEKQLLTTVEEVKVELYGSLALTGKGHGTDFAILLGLGGERPESVDPDVVEEKMAAIEMEHILPLIQGYSVKFNTSEHLLFYKKELLPGHPNGMRLTAISAEGKELLSCIYYSIGGGFIVDEELNPIQDVEHQKDDSVPPYPFDTGKELLQHCQRDGKSIAEIVIANEKLHRSTEQIKEETLNIWSVMQQCVCRGVGKEGILPGGLGVKRRAANMVKRLLPPKEIQSIDPNGVMKWVSAWALAVCEENAAKGRVVTAPTNGAAGVIPAVLHYYQYFCKEATPEGISTFLLTAGAIGILYKQGASISAAEMGCMGEVGVACSMAAAGLTAALGGSPLQVECAAEIGMEHNLGLTCDPVGGLVQIPCIERNTMGALKAINAALLSLESDGTTHKVSLDQVIATMRETGKHMSSIYKETSLGGLAVNVPEC